jgi:cytidine deaminase
MPEPVDRPELIRQAAESRRQAYAPYSDFQVGAAVLGASGRVYTGCNVENVSFGLTVCAERVALFKAVSEGERHFRALAVVTSTGVTPCGACRQVLSEFAPDLEVLVAREGASDYQVHYLPDLLPYGFDSIP